MIKETNATGEDTMGMVLTECINAINEVARHGGFAPCQWVLSKLPRSPATQGDEEEFADIGANQSHIDGPTAFALQNRCGQKARESFIKWGCGEKVQRASPRKAAPVPGPKLATLFPTVAGPGKEKRDSNGAPLAESLDSERSRNWATQDQSRPERAG